jgi:hypothetical protein
MPYPFWTLIYPARHTPRTPNGTQGRQGVVHPDGRPFIMHYPYFTAQNIFFLIFSPLNNSFTPFQPLKTTPTLSPPCPIDAQSKIGQNVPGRSSINQSMLTKQYHVTFDSSLQILLIFSSISHEKYDSFNHEMPAPISCYLAYNHSHANSPRHLFHPKSKVACVKTFILSFRAIVTEKINPKLLFEQT